MRLKDDNIAIGEIEFDRAVGARRNAYARVNVKAHGEVARFRLSDAFRSEEPIDSEKHGAIRRKGQFARVDKAEITGIAVVRQNERRPAFETAALDFGVAWAGENAPGAPARRALWRDAGAGAVADDKSRMRGGGARQFTGV